MNDKEFKAQKFVVGWIKDTTCSDEPDAEPMPLDEKAVFLSTGIGNNWSAFTTGDDPDTIDSVVDMGPMKSDYWEIMMSTVPGERYTFPCGCAGTRMTQKQIDDFLTTTTFLNVYEFEVWQAQMENYYKQRQMLMFLEQLGSALGLDDEEMSALMDDSQFKDRPVN